MESRSSRALVTLLSVALVLLVVILAAVSLYGNRADSSSLEFVLWGICLFLVLPGLLILMNTLGLGPLDSALEGRSEMEEKWQESQMQLTNVLNSVGDPIIAIDALGIVQLGNPAVEKVFGWRQQDLIGKDVRVLMAEPYRSEHQQYIERYLETGNRSAIGLVRAVTGQRKDGSEFPCEISISEVPGSFGIRFVGVIRDMSERVEMSAKLASAERLVAVGELAAGVAHEINNPVNTIINCAQLLADGDDDGSLSQDIIEEGRRIAAIVQGLLDFAKERDEEFNSVDISSLVERTLSLILRRIETDGIEISARFADDLPSVRARPHQIQQVLMNLFLNARDALLEKDTDEKMLIDLRGEVVRIDDGREYVQLIMHDNGIGIAAGEIDKIFQPFVTSKRDRGGSGLGLSVSLGIMQSHGGRLTAHSVPGLYTEMTMLLPVFEAGPEEDNGQDHGS